MFQIKEVSWIALITVRFIFYQNLFLIKRTFPKRFSCKSNLESGVWSWSLESALKYFWEIPLSDAHPSHVNETTFLYCLLFYDHNPCSYFVKISSWCFLISSCWCRQKSLSYLNKFMVYRLLPTTFGEYSSYWNGVNEFKQATRS